MTDLAPLHDAVVDGNAKAAKVLCEQALAGGVPPQRLLDECLVKAMDKVGSQFETGECFVPELLVAARAMKAALEPLRPLLASGAAKRAGKVAIGTVQGDLHDIGKNLVAAMLEGGGFEVVDLGVDVPPEKFVAAVRDQGVQVIALSALLTTTMPAMRATMTELDRAGLRDRVKVMVGGAPITKAFADEIGADGFGTSASTAVLEARRLVA
jgi:5-methyltetrahydrofolate--homocysteine methyltransferase